MTASARRFLRRASTSRSRATRRASRSSSVAARVSRDASRSCAEVCAPSRARAARAPRRIRAAEVRELGLELADDALAALEARGERDVRRLDLGRRVRRSLRLGRHLEDGRAARLVRGVRVRARDRRRGLALGETSLARAHLRLAPGHARRGGFHVVQRFQRHRAATEAAVNDIVRGGGGGVLPARSDALPERRAGLVHERRHGRARASRPGRVRRDDGSNSVTTRIKLRWQRHC